MSSSIFTLLIISFVCVSGQVIRCPQNFTIFEGKKLSINSVSNVRAMGIWMRPMGIQHNYKWKYVLDARPGLNQGWIAYASESPDIGSDWDVSKFHVFHNGEHISSGSLPSYGTFNDKWIFLYVETKTEIANFNDSPLNILGFGQESYSAALESVTIYNRALTSNEIFNIGKGYVSSHDTSIFGDNNAVEEYYSADDDWQRSTFPDCTLYFSNGFVGSVKTKKFSDDNYITNTTYPCQLCKPGTFYSIENGTCQNCPLGTYTDEYNSIQCKACPSGTYGVIESVAECKACSLGKYQPMEASIECRAAYPGTYVSQKGQSHYELCPTGTFSSRWNSTSEKTCLKCGMGDYGVHVGATKCELCNAGSFNNGNSTTACVPCPSGYYSIDGARTCFPCPAGTYSKSGWSTCDPCAPNTYTNTTASTECHPCPKNYATQLSGATSCDSCIIIEYPYTYETLYVNTWPNFPTSTTNEVGNGCISTLSLQDCFDECSSLQTCKEVLYISDIHVCCLKSLSNPAWGIVAKANGMYYRKIFKTVQNLHFSLKSSPVLISMRNGGFEQDDVNNVNWRPTSKELGWNVDWSTARLIKNGYHQMNSYGGKIALEGNFYMGLKHHPDVNKLAEMNQSHTSPYGEYNLSMYLTSRPGYACNKLRVKIIDLTSNLLVINQRISFTNANFQWHYITYNLFYPKNITDIYVKTINFTPHYYEFYIITANNVPMLWLPQLIEGHTYNFHVLNNHDISNHPFRLIVMGVNYELSSQNDKFTVKIPNNTPYLSYRCTVHSDMEGKLSTVSSQVYNGDEHEEMTLINVVLSNDCSLNVDTTVFIDAVRLDYLPFI
jgi:hypothetical protein